MTPSPPDSAAHAHARDLLDFVDASPSPWHAVATLASALSHAGYRELAETDAWTLRPGDRHFVVRGGSSLIAFVVGSAPLAHAGFRMVGAHTDSPGPAPQAQPPDPQRGLRSAWAGGLRRADPGDLHRPRPRHRRSRPGPQRARLRDASGASRPAAGPSCQSRHPHESRGERAGAATAPAARTAGAAGARRGTHRGSARHPDRPAARSPRRPGGGERSPALRYPARQLLGPANEFIADGQLDNLASTHAALRALLAVGDQPVHTAFAAFFDHEEVGSESSVGAAGSFCQDVLMRIGEALGASAADAARARARRLFISADMAHAWNPNFPAAYEPQHRLLVNGGPALKHNASQRYASESSGVARFIGWCEAAGVPWQSYVHRSELGCGSTIGPLVAARLGVTTVDVGAPMWAMHSVRESAGVLDSWWLSKALAQALQAG